MPTSKATFIVLGADGRIRREELAAPMMRLHPEDQVILHLRPSRGNNRIQAKVVRNTFDPDPQLGPWPRSLRSPLFEGQRATPSNSEVMKRLRRFMQGREAPDANHPDTELNAAPIFEELETAVQNAIDDRSSGLAMDTLRLIYDVLERVLEEAV